MRKNFTFMSCLFALYFEQELEHPDRLWKILSDKLGKFDQTPLILPVPNTPNLSEVPIVQVVSKNKAFRLNISRKRVDFFIYGQGKKATYEEIKDLLIRTSKILVEETQKVITIKWAGFVRNYFIEDNNPSSLIAGLIDKGFRKSHDGETTEASIDFITRQKGLNILINNHTQIQMGSARFLDNSKEIKGLVLSRDFNSKPTENKAGYINSDFIIKFIQFSEMNSNLDKIISMLFSN